MTSTDTAFSELLSIRIREIFQREDLLSIDKLRTKTAKDLLNLPGFGPKALSEVKDVLDYFGHQLAG